MVVRGDPHSPWPLFCGDLAFGRQWLQSRLEDPALPPLSAHQILHHALSLGLYAEIEDRLRRCIQPLESVTRRGLEFRIARHRGDANAHQLLIDKDSRNYLNKTDNASFNLNKSIGIVLHGGIGDHLQDISTITAWTRTTHQTACLHLEPARLKQFRRVLNACQESIQATSAPFRYGQGLHILEAHALLEQERIRPQSWINISGKPFRRTVMCCWSAIGLGDRLSSWIRSVPFSTVVNFYQQLIHAGVPGPSILDISNWKPWENHRLKSLGIETLNPAHGDVHDLAAITAASRSVITIDTALVHLCAAMGRSSILLLPLFSDERWVELLKPGSSYAQTCRVVRQRNFGNWSREVDSLMKLLT